LQLRLTIMTRLPAVSPTHRGTLPPKTMFPRFER